MFIMKRTLFILAAVAALCFPASAQQKGEQSLGFFFGYDTGITEYTLNLRSGILSKDWESISLTGLGAELQPLAVEFRPTEKFAMSVSIFSIQGVAMQGKFDFTGGNDFNISGMGLAIDCLMNPQIGFKLYF